jgi:hypothetical protein
MSLFSSTDKPARQNKELLLSKKTHIEMLIVSLCVCVAALLLKINDAGNVCFVLYEQWVAPGLCTSYELLGIECPACGLTRSFICFARLDIARAFSFNRIGPIFAVLVLFQIPYRVWCVRNWPRGAFSRKTTRSVGYLLLAALVVNWLLLQFNI